MDVQHAFLSTVILEQRLQEAVNARITPDFFADDRYRMVYEFLLDHWRSHGVPPDEEVFKRAYPAMPLEKQSQPISYFIQQLRERRMRSILVDGLQAVTPYVRSDEPGAVQKMQTLLAEAVHKAGDETSALTDANFATEEHAAKYLELLDERMLHQGYLRGISTGFRGIDIATG